MIHRNIAEAINDARFQLKTYGIVVNNHRWQGISTASKNDPKSQMLELLHYRFIAPMPQESSTMAELIKPNLPWADLHFAERVSGVPTNPGKAYKQWPFYPKSSDKHIRDKQFTHSYQERIWPKYAGRYTDEELFDSGNANKLISIQGEPKRGIRYEYGDLSDVVNLLHDDPYTRQAYLPIWFPEDTGAVHRGRVPCSLGYWFTIRNSTLDIEYHIRACDLLRHFNDDVYFACLLGRHVIWELRTKSADDFEKLSFFNTLRLGNLVMNIGSLHVFAPEKNLL